LRGLLRKRGNKGVAVRRAAIARDKVEVSSQPASTMFQGPGDSRIRHNELEGYSVVSRIGEIVSNAFIDSQEWAMLPDVVTKGEIFPDATDRAGDTYETKAHFHTWASVLPGMLTVSRKARNNTFRSYVATETAVPCISCASMLGPDDEPSFFFSGVARSKSVVPIDDGQGPTIDEYFTVALAGQVTILNSSGRVVYPGEDLSWGFATDKETRYNKADKQNPRRIICKPSPPSGERVFGRCLSFGGPNQPIDVLLKP